MGHAWPPSPTRGVQHQHHGHDQDAQLCSQAGELPPKARLLWFFIVPVPGLFVFTAREYRICIELSTIIHALCWAIGLTVTSYWIGLFIERLERTGFKGGGLAGRIANAYRQFQNAVRIPGRFSDQDISGIYALFTDAQTYLDQRSYEHADRSLSEIQAKLRPALPGTT
jgi:hypothetical protein